MGRKIRARLLVLNPGICRRRALHNRTWLHSEFCHSEFRLCSTNQLDESRGLSQSLFRWGVSPHIEARRAREPSITEPLKL